MDGRVVLISKAFLDIMLRVECNAKAVETLQHDVVAAMRLQRLWQMCPVDRWHDVEASKLGVLAAHDTNIAIRCEVVIITVVVSSAVRLK